MITGRGYSTRTIGLNRAGKPSHLGVKLGRFCINHNIPVAEVARLFKVSRQTVYNWFAGSQLPSKRTCELIEDYLSRAKS